MSPTDGGSRGSDDGGPTDGGRPPDGGRPSDAGRSSDDGRRTDALVREADPGDGPRLRAIQAAALAESWPELLETGLDGPPLVLLVEADRPVGYALVVAHEDVAYLAEFAVAPDRQGQGFGTRLLTALFERLRDRGIERVRLTARADDERVRAFYESFGFSVVEAVPDHYEDGDGVLMAREL